MAEIKLIALDLDGTLLDSQKRLSSRNERALKECIRRGIAVVPCTGRIWFAVPEVVRSIPGIRYAITTNGAVIEDVAEKKILDERKMSCKLTMEILELGKQFHTMYDVYAAGLAFGETRFLEHMELYGISPLIQKMIRETRQSVPDVIAQVKELDQPAEKVNYFFADEQERSRARKALLARGDVIVSSSLPNNLEINALGATKGEAILRLAAHLGLAPDQTMGFGDGENDVNMIQLAGIGVVMGNALESLKEHADYITCTNDEDGVADAIEKLVLTEKE
ncbi:Cof-type HAD-IIB family hydrolase [Clostridium sp. AN503]|uniref:Cof-type HAD-IIB family hydrolase n=1 Tax=Clostridium sp. AN503 TaxID=3160598 RepID=UPI00345A2011